MDEAGILHCYTVYTGSKQLPQAKTDCASRGQHLVTISSKEEFDFVLNTMVNRKLIYLISYMSLR